MHNPHSFARDGGCTKPGCTIGAYGCQVHHVVADWADGGNTNVDENGLACGPDNRSVDNNGGWTTAMNEHHEVEWTPPPHLDTGRARLNYYHRPDRLLRPPDESETQSNNDTGPVIPTGADDIAEDTGDNRCDETEPGAPPRNDRDDEPGGPAPPEGRAA